MTIKIKDVILDQDESVDLEKLFFFYWVLGKTQQASKTQKKILSTDSNQLGECTLVGHDHEFSIFRDIGCTVTLGVISRAVFSWSPGGGLTFL